MLFKILMLFSLTTMSCGSTDIELLKKSNEAVIDIVGEEIFTNHIKLDSSLIKFYKKDFTYDNLQN